MTTQQQTQESYAEIKKSLETAKSVFVFIPQNASLDTTAAALSLFLSLTESGKSVMIGSSGEIKVEVSRLVGVDKIKNKVGNRNLIISFDYKEDSIEKVSYNVEGDKFNLVIQPRPEFPPLDTNGVDFSYEGLDADLIFVVGAQKLENLGEIYQKERQAFSDSKLVNIDRAPANTKFGQINILDPKSASISELSYKIINKISLPINVDIAGNLLKGIEAQTQNFQAPFTSAETFETAAELMRSGAKRSPSAAQPMKQWDLGGQSPFPMKRQSPFPQTTTQSPLMRPMPQMGKPLDMQGNMQQTLPPSPQNFKPSRPGLTSQPNMGKTNKPSGQVTGFQEPPLGQVGKNFQGQVKEDQAGEVKNIQKNITHKKSNKNNNQQKNNWQGPKIYSGKTKV